LSPWGSRVSGSSIGVSGFEFRHWDFRLRVQALGFRASGSGIGISGFGFRHWGFGLRVQALGFRASQFESNYFTEMCSGSEAGSYLRLIDFMYHSTLGLRVITKKKKFRASGFEAVQRTGQPLLFFFFITLKTKVE